MKTQIISQLLTLDTRILVQALSDPESFGYPYENLDAYAESWIEQGISEEYIEMIPSFLRDTYSVED